MQITFIFSLDTEEPCIIHSKSDDAEIKIRIERDNVINKLFESSFKKYQERLETKMIGIDFVF